MNVGCFLFSLSCCRTMEWKWYISRSTATRLVDDNDTCVRMSVRTGMDDEAGQRKLRNSCTRSIARAKALHRFRERDLVSRCKSHLAVAWDHSSLHHQMNCVTTCFPAFKCARLVASLSVNCDLKTTFHYSSVQFNFKNSIWTERKAEF